MRPRHFASAVGLGLLAAAFYLPTVGHAPTYDDHTHVLGHPVVEGALDPWGAHYFAVEFPDQARPVLVASLALDHSVYEGRFSGHHLTNALLHGGVTALLLLLLVSLGLSEKRSLVGAALFAIHPACTEAVASVSHREDVLATGGVLLASVAAVHTLRQRRLAPRVLLSALSGVALLFALGAKEMALATPLLLVAFVALAPSLQRRSSAFRANAIAVGFAYALPLGAFAALQLRMGLPGLRVAAGGAPLGLQGRLPDASWGDAIALAGFRLLRTVGGWPLSAEHDLAALSGPLPMAAAALALLALLLLAFASWRRDPLVALASVGFFVCTAPVSLSPWLLNPAADRFLYLPAALVVGLLGARLLEPRGAGPLLLAAAFAFFVPYSLARMDVWRDDVSLFTDAVAHAPGSARAAQNLGAALLTAGSLDRAEPELRRAAQLDPGLMAPHVNLALVAARRRDSRGALERLADALERESPPGERALRERAFALQAGLLSRLSDREALEAATRLELARAPDNRAAQRWRRRLRSTP